MAKKASDTWKNRIVGEADVDPATITENPLNFRTHPKFQQQALGDVLDRVGWVGRVIVNKRTGRLIDGHLRLSLALTNKEKSIPVQYVDLDEHEERLILATFDPITALAGADSLALTELLKDVSTDSAALQKLMADVAEAAGMALDQCKDGECDPDDIPEAPDPITNTGDLWLLDGHRLLCGDSANKADVERLMDGHKAQCIFTDPPYGVSVGAKNRMLNTFQKSGRCLDNIKDDDLTPDELKQQLLPAFSTLRSAIMADDATLFVTAPQGGELCMMMMMMMKDAGLPIRHVLIWKKNAPTFSMGRLDYDYQHEPILLTWGKKHKRPMNGKHKTSIWEVDKPRSSKEHPTMKPVELYVNAYMNNSDPGDSVADIYAGSGTAFIAAEQTGRTCYGMEISPAYCDVIVKRWELFAGKKAERVTI